jgi:mannan endo-1,4-beta-mannosidase
VPDKTPSPRQSRDSQELEPTRDEENDANESEAPATADSTFAIAGRQLVDPSGQPFVMRGINLPVAYFKDQSLAALDRIDALGFNTVRIVWCADNLMQVGRCEEKDIHAPGDLANLLGALKERGLVAVLNLQNATGSDRAADLAAMVDYLIKPGVKEVLNRYQDMLILNVANEWHGTFNETGRSYIDPYLTAISRLRAADLAHVLVIDAIGYGQNTQSIRDHYQELLAADGNLLLAGHMYEVFEQPQAVSSWFQFARDNQIPFVVGEFGCEHIQDQVVYQVACDRIMAEAADSVAPFGYIAWSYTGNGGDLNILDVVDPADWTTLTTYGQRLVNGADGIAETSQKVCHLNPGVCDP